MSNPYKEECLERPCKIIPTSPFCIRCLACQEGLNAGLEAAAERCEAEHAELEEIARGRSGWIRALAEERALVSARLADEIRNIKDPPPNDSLAPCSCGEQEVPRGLDALIDNRATPRIWHGRKDCRAMKGGDEK